MKRICPPIIETGSGIQLNLLDPRPQDIVIEDIAAALSKLCRYTGHCPRHYSVAEHSLMVAIDSDITTCHPLVQLEALLHDAAEAYVGDVAAPLKTLLGDTYRVIEARVDSAIRHRFGLPAAMSKEVHVADMRVALAEMRDFGMRCFERERIALKVSPSTDRITIGGILIGSVRERFLNRFYDLSGMIRRTT